MADPHNMKRYGETWPLDRICACLEELQYIREHIIISGGWAWHFISPPGHTELKHAHDHKDIDIFVRPHNVTTVINALATRGFKKVPTKYDHLKGNNDFRRYEKVKDSHKITVDFFINKDIPSREIRGWLVVDPTSLIPLYSTIHSSSSCFAVVAAQKLLAEGQDPVGREELVQIPKGIREKN